MEKRTFIFYKDNILSILGFFYHYRALLTLTLESFWSIISVLSCPILLASHLLIGIRRMANPKPARNAKPTCMCNKYRDTPTWNGRLQNAWKLGQKFTTRSVSVLIKLTISPVLNFDDDTLLTRRAFLYTVVIIEHLILSPTTCML